MTFLGDFWGLEASVAEKVGNCAYRTVSNSRERRGGVKEEHQIPAQPSLDTSHHSLNMEIGIYV